MHCSSAVWFKATYNYWLYSSRPTCAQADQANNLSLQLISTVNETDEWMQLQHKS